MIISQFAAEDTEYVSKQYCQIHKAFMQQLMAEININQQRAMPYLKAKKKKESSLFILLTCNFSSSASSPRFSSTNEELKPENSHLSQSLQRRHLHHSAIHYPTVVNQGSPRKAPSPVQRTSDTADVNLSFSTVIATNTSKSSQTPLDGGSEQQKRNLHRN